MVSWVKGLYLGSFSVKELAGHAWLTDRYCHTALEFSAHLAFFDVLWLWDNDMLLSVVVSIGGTEILCILKGSLAVAIVKVGDDMGVQFLNLLLKGRKCLNSIFKQK